MTTLFDMPAPVQNYPSGLPVEIGQIDRALKKLWADAGNAVTRASLVNLAVYSEEPASLARNTGIISKITEDHACRAIVISANRAAKENRVEAWISAHCHISRAGSKQVCSEQISFSLEGPCVKLLPSIVFSHLDSDLPFYFWWQGPFHDPMDPQLWAWVDRLIYDSVSWKNFGAQMRLLETARSEAKQRIVFCDLNWTSLAHVRLALAQFFDHPDSHRHFSALDQVQIEFATGFKSTATLFIGWLASQLKWKLRQNSSPTTPQFVDSADRTIGVKLVEKAGEPISRITLRTRALEFCVSHMRDADFLEVSRSNHGEKIAPHLMPAGRNDPADLVNEELMRGGPHRIYLRAVESVRDLLDLV